MRGIAGVGCAQLPLLPRATSQSSGVGTGPPLLPPAARLAGLPVPMLPGPTLYLSQPWQGDYALGLDWIEARNTRIWQPSDAQRRRPEE